MKELQPPFNVGDTIVHVKDPFKERHEVMEIVTDMGDIRDYIPRFIIKSERTGELMPLIISRVGLAGWKKE